METPTTNLEILKPSRKRLNAGDIFVLRPAGHPYYFGRVIRTDSKISGTMPANLIYLYQASSNDRGVIPALTPSELLVPPLFTNRLPWSRGYLETVAHSSLTPWDVMKRHVFFDVFFDRFIDEYGQRVPDPGYAVGPYGLASFRVIDDVVSQALGIPLVPDDPSSTRGRSEC